ncbi:MAG: TraR/DksA C4-type zinc finger protein [Bryobacterales bacterium]|nr:TraR/DksA C4-type zinc finger protein [Bryobacterales bacterium]
MKSNRVQSKAATPAEFNPNVFRRMLEEKRQDLLVALGVKFDTIARAGRVAEEDQAQMSHDEFISLSRNKQDYQALKLVDEALDRIAAGDYGVCQRCEEPISPRRLEVLPWAKYCVRCQDRIAARADHQEDDAHVLANVW